MKKILMVAMILGTLALAGCPKKEMVPAKPDPKDCVIHIPRCDCPPCECEEE